MAELLARGYITISAVNDGYNPLLTASSVSIPANHDGSKHDLTHAKTLVSLYKGESKVPMFISSIVASTSGITYTQKVIDQYTCEVSITGIASNITSGYLKITVGTSNGYKTSVHFGFAVIKNTTTLDWIEEWNGTKTQINGNYVITPKLFAGRKEPDGKITGVYLGRIKGFLGETSIPGQADQDEGIYGYKRNKLVFYINGKDAKIGGWLINPNGIQCEDGTLTLLSEGTISSQHSGITNWILRKDGSASFANGKVIMDAAGNASFDGKITARTGMIAGWNITSDAIYLGTKNNTDSQFTSDIYSITIGTNGIRGRKFRFEKSGAGSIAGGNIYWDANGNIIFSNTVKKFWKDDIGVVQNNLNTQVEILNGKISSKVSSETFNDEMERKSILAACNDSNIISNDPSFRRGNNGIVVYNGTGSNAVTIVRTAGCTVNSSGYCLEVRTAATGDVYPNLGGFTFAIETSARKRFVAVFSAWLDKGREFVFSSNQTGNNSRHIWLTDMKGKGTWATYALYVECGVDGTFSSTFYFSVFGGSRPVLTRISYAAIHQLDYDQDFKTRISSAESKIIQHTNLIASKVSKTDFDKLGNRVSNTESNITQHANLIASKVSQVDFNALGNKVSSAESTIIQHTGLIASKVSKTDFDKLGNRVSSAESSITQHTNLIASKVSKTDFDSLGNRVSSAESKIIQNSNEIKSKVTSTEVTNIANKQAEIKARSKFLVPDSDFASDVVGDVYFGITKMTKVNALAGCPTSFCGKSSRRDAYSNWSVPVSAGESIYIEAWINAEQANHLCGIGLWLENDNGGKTWPLVFTIPAHTKGWCHKSGTITIPEGYDKARILFRINGFENFGNFYFASVISSGSKGALMYSKELSKRVSSAESSITQHANLIASKVSQTDFNALGNRVSNAESTITQHTSLIASKVSKTDFDTLGKKVASAESSITQHANLIASKVNKNDFNALSNRVASAESTITQHANMIATKVTSTDAVNIANKQADIAARGRFIVPDSDFSSNVIQHIYYAVTQIARANAPAGCPTQFCGRSSQRDAYGERYVDVNPGEKIYIEAWVNTEQANHQCNVGLWIESENGTLDWPFAFGVPAKTKGWQHHSGVITIPAGFKKARIFFQIGAHENFGHFYFTSVIASSSRGALVYSEGLEKRITTSETSITQLSNSIKLKADQATVDGINNRLSSAEVSIQPDSIWNTVSKKVTQVAVDVSKKTFATIDARGIDANTYWPVTIKLYEPSKQYKICVYRTLDAGLGKPAWSTHDRGFSLMCVWTTNACGWGSIPVKRIIEECTTAWSKQMPVSCIDQMTNTSHEYILVRGGSVYYFEITGAVNVPVQIHLNGFSAEGEHISPRVYNESIVIDNFPVVSKPTREEIKAGIGVTTNGVTVFGKTISLSGKVTFSSLDANAQGKINTAQSTANSAVAKANAAQSTANTARTEAIEKARLGNTIINGGFIRTELLDVKTLFTKEINANAFNLTSGNIGPFSVSASSLSTSVTDSAGHVKEFVLNADTIRFRYDLTKGRAAIGGNAAKLMPNGRSLRCSAWFDGGTEVGAYLEGSTPLVVTGGDVFLTPNTGGSVYVRGVQLNVRYITTSGTVNNNDDVVFFDSATNITVNLGNSNKIGRRLYIKNVGRGATTLTGGNFMHPNDAGVGTGDWRIPGQVSYMIILVKNNTWCIFYCG